MQPLRKKKSRNLSLIPGYSRVLQEVEKNKTKNMRPLWEAAKKTVDGGIKELKMIIEERRKNTDDEDTVVLKLEVLERDLELISMVGWRSR